MPRTRRLAAMLVAVTLLGVLTVEQATRRAALASATTGCQFRSSPGATPAFCDDLSQGPKSGGRNGDLDPTRWSVARTVGGWDSNHLMSFPSTPVRPCKTGVSSVSPDNDVLVCDAASGHQGQLETAMSAQNYGVLSMRPRQPFDFAGRTGTISFNVDASSWGPESWWPSLYVTEDPSPAASYQQSVAGNIPRNGVGFSIDGNNCPGPIGGQERINTIFSFADYTETAKPVPNNPCILTQPGSLNHVEVQLSQTSIAVWASDSSTDGGQTFPNFQLIGSVPITLGFSRGYVHFQQEERAPAKYSSNPPYANNYWSDLGFDGPQILGETGYQVPDAPATGIGYGLLSNPNSTYDSAGPLGPFTVPGVDLTNVTSAALSFTIGYYDNSTQNSSTFATKYRLNGGAWTPVSPTPEYAKALYCGTWCNNPPPPFDANWQMAFSFPVAVTALHPGANTLEIAEDGAQNGSPPVLANIDLMTFRSGSPPPPTTTTTVPPTTTAMTAPHPGPRPHRHHSGRWPLLMLLILVVVSAVAWLANRIRR